MPLLTQKEFADKLRNELPELQEFSDAQIVNKVLDLRPDLRDKIENPLSGDAAAANAQAKAERASKSLIDPEFWNKHPNLKGAAKSTLSALPTIGMMGGGALATPETLGAGTVIGGGLGAGVGRGLQDLGNQALGLEETTPMQKAQNITKDTLLSLVVPGLVTAMKYPIPSARLAAGSLSSLEDALVPKTLKPFVKTPILDKFASGGKVVDPFVRPPWQYNLPPPLTKEEELAKLLYKP